MEKVLSKMTDNRLKKKSFLRPRCKIAVKKSFLRPRCEIAVKNGNEFSLYLQRPPCPTTPRTAEDIWFQCGLYRKFIPSINLLKKPIDLRLFSKCLEGPFLRSNEASWSKSRILRLKYPTVLCPSIFPKSEEVYNSIAPC